MWWYGVCITPTQRLGHPRPHDRPLHHWLQCVLALLLPCCCPAVALLLPCCCPAVALLLPCCCPAVALPLPCCCPAVALLLPCCCPAGALLLPCCCPAVALLLPCYCPAVVADTRLLGLPILVCGWVWWLSRTLSLSQQPCGWTSGLTQYAAACVMWCEVYRDPCVRV